jgi:hypothetical protein
MKTSAGRPASPARRGRRSRAGRCRRGRRRTRGTPGAGEPLFDHRDDGLGAEGGGAGDGQILDLAAQPFGRPRPGQLGDVVGLDGQGGDLAPQPLAEPAAGGVAGRKAARSTAPSGPIRAGWVRARRPRRAASSSARMKSVVPSVASRASRRLSASRAAGLGASSLRLVPARRQLCRGVRMSGSRGSGAAPAARLPGLSARPGGWRGGAGGGGGRQAEPGGGGGHDDLPEGTVRGGTGIRQAAPPSGGGLIC